MEGFRVRMGEDELSALSKTLGLCVWLMERNRMSRFLSNRALSEPR